MITTRAEWDDSNKKWIWVSRSGDGSVLVSVCSTNIIKGENEMSLTKGTPISSQVITLERMLQEREDELNVATEQIENLKYKLETARIGNVCANELVARLRAEDAAIIDSLKRDVNSLQEDLVEARWKLSESSKVARESKIQSNGIDFTGVNIALLPQASEADLAILGAVLNHLIETADSIVESNTLPFRDGRVSCLRVGDMTTMEPFELGWYLETIKLIKDVAELKLKLTGSNCKEDCSENE